MKTTRKSSFVSALVLTALGAAGGASSGTQADSHLYTPRRTVTVQLAAYPDERAQDLKELAHLDFMGLNVKTSRAQFYVSESELADLRARGFQLSFGGIQEQFADGPSTEDLQKYLSPTALEAKLKQLQSASQGLMTLREIGRTHRKRPIWMAELTSPNGDSDSKPTILFNGMHHAREVMTTEVAVHIIETFLNTITKPDATLQRWLDHYRILVVPQVNPDGNDFVHNGQAMWRKNAWAPQTRPVGVDLNRNYSANWNKCNGSSGHQGDSTYRGPSAASEPEVKAMMALVEAERPVANISYHTYSEMILYPFGCKNEVNTAVDLFKNIAADIRKLTLDDTNQPNTYAVGTPPELLYSADGGDMDWQWKAYGVIAFAMEVNSDLLGFAPNYSKWRNETVRRLEGSWKALLGRMGTNAIRAKIVSSDGSSLAKSVTYRMERKGFGGGAAAWADSDVAPFGLRNASGLFYQIALPGEYSIVFLRDGVEDRRVAVTVGAGVTDLGTIEF